MKVKMIYRPGSKGEEEINHLLDSLEQYRVEPELVNVDSREGQALVKLYDIVVHPAVLVTKNDGSLVKVWKEQLPRATDVSYYLH